MLKTKSSSSPINTKTEDAVGSDPISLSLSSTSIVVPETEQLKTPSLKRISLLDPKTAIPVLLSKIDTLDLKKYAQSALKEACAEVANDSSHEIAAFHLIATLWIRECAAKSSGDNQLEMPLYKLDANDCEAKLQAIKYLSLCATICCFAKAPEGPNLLSSLNGAEHSVFANEKTDRNSYNDKIETQNLISRLSEVEERRLKLALLVRDNEPAGKGEEDPLENSSSLKLLVQIDNEYNKLQALIKERLNTPSETTVAPFSKIGFKGGLLLKHGYESCGFQSKALKNFFKKIIPEEIATASAEQIALAEGYLSPFINFREERSATYLKESDLKNFNDWMQGSYSQLTFKQIVQLGASPRELNKLCQEWVNKAYLFGSNVIDAPESWAHPTGWLATSVSIVAALVWKTSPDLITSGFVYLVAPIGALLMDLVLLEQVRKLTRDEALDRRTHHKACLKRYTASAILGLGIPLALDYLGHVLKKKRVLEKIKRRPDFRLKLEAESGVDLPIELK